MAGVGILETHTGDFTINNKGCSKADQCLFQRRQD